MVCTLRLTVLEISLPVRRTQRVREAVCVSACLLTYLKNHMAEFHQIFRSVLVLELPVAVSRSSSGSVAISYVLPVLWMTACFHDNEPYGAASEARV